MSVADFKSRCQFDLVYVDPPYVRNESAGSDVNYLLFYHFLEGAADPARWASRINYDSSILRIVDSKLNEWIYPKHNLEAFGKLFERFRNSIIVVSYKNPGIPSRRDLIHLLKKYKKNVISVPGHTYDYALNKNNGFHKEYLLIGIDK
jgi:adenine-specific DNA methylase